MRQPVSACKERWSRLRDNYRKALKFRKFKSGDAAIKVKPYKFEVEMSFLKKFLPDRDQKTNVTRPASADINSPISSEDVEEDQLGDTNASDAGPVTPPPAAASTSKSKTFRPTPTSAKRKKLQPQITQPSSVASVLEKYLEITTTATNSGGNSLKQFFLAMSETAQSFPPELQIEVKAKIFNIIQDAELKCLRARNTMQIGNVHSTGFHFNQNVYPERPQYTQHTQDIQHSYTQHMQSLGTQPIMTPLNSQYAQHSQDTPQPSHPQHTLASQPQLTLLQNMQPSHQPHIQSIYSSTSPELLSDNESNL